MKNYAYLKQGLIDCSRNVDIHHGVCKSSSHIEFQGKIVYTLNKTFNNKKIEYELGFAKLLTINSQNAVTSKLKEQ